MMAESPLKHLSTLPPKQIALVVGAGVGVGLVWRHFHKKAPTATVDANGNAIGSTPESGVGTSSTGPYAGAGGTPGSSSLGGSAGVVVPWVITGADGQQYLTDGVNVWPYTNGQLGKWNDTPEPAPTTPDTPDAPPVVTPSGIVVNPHTDTPTTPAPAPSTPDYSSASSSGEGNNYSQFRANILWIMKQTDYNAWLAERLKLRAIGEDSPIYDTAPPYPADGGNNPSFGGYTGPVSGSSAAGTAPVIAAHGGSSPSTLPPTTKGAPA